MISARFTLDKRFTKQMVARFEGYSLKVGVLRNRLHKPAASKKAGRASVLGGPARKTKSAKKAELVKKLKTVKSPKQAKFIRSQIKSLGKLKAPTRTTIKDVLSNMQKASGVNVLIAPFKLYRSQAMRKFTKEFLTASSKKRSMVRAQKYLLDVVREPIVKKKYGKNSRAAQRRKGFDRRFIDTGQVVLGIESQIKKQGGR